MSNVEVKTLQYSTFNILRFIIQNFILPLFVRFADNFKTTL